VKPTTNPQLVINRLAERCLEKAWLSVKCNLGRELLSRRGGACSACVRPQEFELDREVAHLIDTSVFRRAGACPYRIVASHLVAGLTFGPETFRSKSIGKVSIDPVMEVKTALRHVRTVLGACGLSREDIDALNDKGDLWAALCAVLSAERALADALALFQPLTSKKTRRSPPGRTGVLHHQALARAMAGAWRALTGRLPAKDNVRFHELLHAATTTIFGHPLKEPNWESATKKAVKRIKRDAASRT
jgi:hypothetical protein